MKLSRLIALPTVILTLATLGQAQQPAKAATDIAPEKIAAQKLESEQSIRATSSESLDKDTTKIAGAPENTSADASLDTRSNLQRAATANLFTGVRSPFAEITEANRNGETNPEPQAVDEDKWHFQLTPYVWIAGITGQAGIGNLILNIDAGLGDPNVNLNFGFMATFEARKNKFIIVTDLQFSNLGTEEPTPGPLFTSATADFKTFILDPEVGYRLVENEEKGAFIDVMGGIRYWHLRSDLTFTAGLLPPVIASRSTDWVDGVGGIRGKAHVTKRVFLTGKADLGGGGSKLTYQLFGGVGILVGKRYALIAGYRDLDVNYNRNNFLFDVALHGPVFGFGIKF